MKKSIITSALTTIFVLSMATATLAAPNFDGNRGNKNSKPPMHQIKHLSAEQITQAANSKISLDQAISLAKKHAKGDLINARFDPENNGSYRLDFIDPQTNTSNANNTKETKNNKKFTKVIINANTGALIESKEETLKKPFFKGKKHGDKRGKNRDERNQNGDKNQNNRSEQSNLPAPIAPKIGFEQALQLASKAVNGKAIAQRFAPRRNQAVYQTTLIKGDQIHQITLDANTGKILRQQIDYQTNP